MTSRQLQLLNFIRTHTQQFGCCPSFDEMKVALCLRSKSGIHRIVNSLEDAGYIRRRPHRARAIELTTPDNRPDLQAAFHELKHAISPHFIRGVDLRNARQVEQIGLAFRNFERLLVDDGLPMLPDFTDPLMLAHKSVSA